MSSTNSVAYLTILLVVSAILKVDECAVQIQPPLAKPEKYACQEGCYSDIYDVVLTPNVQVNPKCGKCHRLTCQDNGNTVIYTCGVVAAGSNCTIEPGDKSLPYPDCCQTVACKADE